MLLHREHTGFDTCSHTHSWLSQSWLLGTLYYTTVVVYAVVYAVVYLACFSSCHFSAVKI